MSLFNWLSREKQTKAPPETGAGPAEPSRGGAPAPAAPHKTDRMARRELLYSVVRESMARAGVLSASYRFKVLSLDAAGRQFLVMVDLASSERAGAELLCDIEAVIVQRAKSRHDLVVSGVYWRRSDQVGAGARPAPGRQQPRGAAAAAKPSQPAELLSDSPPSIPAPQQPATAGSFDPIEEDELAALRAALANGVGAGGQPAPAPTPARAPARAGAASPAAAEPAASGFPDTVIRRDADARSRTLSPTQAGDLN